MQLRVTRSVLRAIEDHAAYAAPDECCGLLLGTPAVLEQAHPAANVAQDRPRRFEIDPQALVDAHRAARAGGPQVIGYYHSHPGGQARPSVIDHIQAAHDGAVWAIAAPGGVALWRDDEAGFVRLPYRVVER